jgi:two-component system response regulator (stage 0 sporulation protein F)
MVRILLVDDEKHICQLYDEELSDEGYEVITLDSGERLSQRISFLQPDVVVLDIRLDDGWDGLELLQDIKNTFFDLPVIICTAYDSFKYDLRSAAADYYVVKSDNLSELKEKIRRVIQAVESASLAGMMKTNSMEDRQPHQFLLGESISRRYS